jgi:non-homologous end joining protein Ku
MRGRGWRATAPRFNNCGEGDIPGVKVEPDMLELAQHILQSKATDFDPSQFVDRYPCDPTSHSRKSLD